MRHIARFNAKTPRLLFTEDGDEKLRQATDRIWEAAAAWLEPVYRRLEESRAHRRLSLASGASEVQREPRDL